MSYCIYLKQKMNRNIYCKKSKKIITLKDCSNCPYKEFKIKNKYKYRPKKGKCNRYYNNVSIMPVSTLYFDKETKGCEKHHIFGGVANRPKSEQYGLFVWMTEEQHRYLHNHPLEMTKLKKIAQTIFMNHYNKSENEFKSIFGKNLL